MATVRELVTKLKSKADVSGIRKFGQALKENAKASVQAAKKTRDENKQTTDFLIRRSKKWLASTLRDTQNKVRAEKRLTAVAVRNTKKEMRAKINEERKAARERIREIRKVERERRRSARRGRSGGGMRVPSIGGGGAGLGSIISGNVIANAITAGFRQAISSVKELFTSLIGAAAGIEKVEAEFGVMLGSGERAKTLIEDLKRVGAETPLQFQDLAKNARILLQYGSSVDDVIDQLIMLGDVVGGDKNRFDFMTFAFAQMQSAGKLMGQELRQMTNAGFNPLEQMAKKTGLTMTELRKEMEMGTISSADVTEAFRMSTSEGGRFFNNMAVQAKTFTGRVSTMRDELFMMMEAMGQRLLPGMKNAVNAIINFVKTTGREIGINLMDSILPAINAVIAGMERFIKVVFRVDKIGAFLRDKDQLGQFFQELASTIDEAFIWITAAALKLKEWFSKNWDTITQGMMLLLWGIKKVIEYLPQFITLWAGLKLAGIATALSGVALAIGGIVKSLMGLTMANPLLAATVASLAAIVLAAEKAYQVLRQNEDLEERQAKIDKIADEQDRQIERMKQMKSLEESIAEKLKDPDINDRERERLHNTMARAMEEKDIAYERVKSLGRERTMLSTGRFGGEGIVDKITGMFNNLSMPNLSMPSLSGPGGSFDKMLSDIRKTSVTQNFFNKFETKVDVKQNMPKAANDDVLAKESAKFIKKMFNQGMVDQYANLSAVSSL
jgi:tape measure domain-containing protein